MGAPGRLAALEILKDVKTTSSRTKPVQVMENEATPAQGGAR